jgi:predicted HAD superfamily Cof-like phosphohydrolase
VTSPDYTRSHQANVSDFHDKFRIPNGISRSNRLLSDADTLLRVRLLTEEFVEYVTAVLDGDLIEIADALGDMDYIINGTAAMQGSDLDDLHEEIHASNMSKADANGNPIFREDGKVLKSDLFFRPDIEEVLTRSGGPVPAKTPVTGDTRSEIAVIILSALSEVVAKVERPLESETV